MNETDDLLRSFGGLKLVRGRAVVWNFGVLSIGAPEHTPDFKAAAPHLKGSGAGKVTLLYEAARTVMGQDLDPGPQKIGDCFPAGTLVQMADGTERPIEQVRSGEMVLSHRGRPRRVLDTLRKQYTGDMVALRVKGYSFPVAATADHHFVAVGADGNESWQPVGELAAGDRVLLPYGVDAGDRDYQAVSYLDKLLVADERFARLAGLYLAEGGVTGSKSSPLARVVFNLGAHEKLLIEEVRTLGRALFGVVGKARHKTPTVTVVQFDSVPMAKFFKGLFPGNTYSKRVPAAFFLSPRSVRLALLRGWMDGDGHTRVQECFGYKSLKVQGVSASAGLRRDMHRVALSCRLRPTALERKQAPHQTVASGDVFLYGEHALAVYPELASEVRRSPQTALMAKRRMTANGLAAEVCGVARRHVTDETVYCLHVDEDHSFIANGYAVHNCVSWGWAGSSDLLACVQALTGSEEFTWDLRACTEAIYALSRVEVGGQSGSYSDGSTGEWAAGAVSRYGVLSRKQLGPYDPQRAKSWGAKGLPDDLEPKAREHLVRTVTLVKTFEEARDALANGYPVPVCSDVGFETGSGGAATRRDANGFSKARGSWSHCMKFVAARDDGKPGLLCMQSWGKDASADGPKGDFDIPDNSWWVDPATCNRMLGQRDSYAVSSFVGYPAQTLPWRF